MSDEAWAIPAPAFKAEEALVGLKRQLRELRPLAERGNRFELHGVPVIELAAGADAISARIVQRPTASATWVPRTITSAAEMRRFVDDMRSQLRRWERDE